MAAMERGVAEADKGLCSPNGPDTHRRTVAESMGWPAWSSRAAPSRTRKERNLAMSAAVEYTPPAGLEKPRSCGPEGEDRENNAERSEKLAVSELATRGDFSQRE